MAGITKLLIQQSQQKNTYVIGTFTPQLPVTTESLLSQPLDQMRDWVATWTTTNAYLAQSLITTYTTT